MQLKGVKNYDEQSIFEAWSIIADMLVDILSIDFKFGLIDPSNLLINIVSIESTLLYYFTG